MHLRTGLLAAIASFGLPAAASAATLLPQVPHDALRDLIESGSGPDRALALALILALMVASGTVLAYMWRDAARSLRSIAHRRD